VSRYQVLGRVSYFQNHFYTIISSIHFYDIISSKHFYHHHFINNKIQQQQYCTTAKINMATTTTISVYISYPS